MNKSIHTRVCTKKKISVCSGCKRELPFRMLVCLFICERWFVCVFLLCFVLQTRICLAHTHTQTHKYANFHILTHKYTHSHTHTHTHTQIHKCTNCLSLCLCICWFANADLFVFFIYVFKYFFNVFYLCF